MTVTYRCRTISFGVMLGAVLFAVYTSTCMAVGANTSFQIRTFVGTDTLAPTTPALTLVTPVSQTEISVEWSTAVDDVLLIGYRLFRDGTQIATTTQTSFDDTGLTSNTLYTYTVDAYDSFNNFSSSSLAVATTTFAQPVVVSPPPAQQPHSTHGTLIPILQLFDLVPSEREAAFHWRTGINTRYTIRWGRTTSYELGSVSTNLFKQAHETTLVNLEAGTHYWYSIIVEDVHGITQILKVGDFMTLPVYQSVALSNVRNLQAVVQGNTVTLSWINPPPVVGAQIRIVRNHLFYPTSPTDGALVYEGYGATAEDEGALSTRSPQYYTVFVLNEAGGFSSGAIISVTKKRENEVPPPPVSTTSTTVSTSTISELGEETVLRVDAIFIRQGSVTQVFTTALKVVTDTPYILYIPVEAVTTHLKSIIVSVEDPTDQRIVTRYLLKLNKNGDAYEAVILAPGAVGVGEISVEVFDFNLASVRRISTQITFVLPSLPAVIFPDAILRYIGPFFIPVTLAFFVLTCTWWLLLRRRSREDNE